MDRNLECCLDPSHRLSDGFSIKAFKNNGLAVSEEAVDCSDLVRSIQSLAGMASDHGLPLLMALLRGVAERLEPSLPVNQPCVEPARDTPRVGSQILCADLACMFSDARWRHHPAPFQFSAFD